MNNGFKKGMTPWNKGIKMTEEQKSKLNIEGLKKGQGGNKGIPMCEEQKKKLSNSLKGRNVWNKGMIGCFSEEAIEKNRIAHLGKTNSWKGSHHTDDAKKKISEMSRGKLSGEKHWNWQGGKTDINRRDRNNWKQIEWKKKVFERDGFSCKMPGCNHSEKYLEAHHIKRFSEFKELRLDINNGITLCKECHKKTKTKEILFNDIFMKIIKNLKCTSSAGATNRASDLEAIISYS